MGGKQKRPRAKTSKIVQEDSGVLERSGGGENKVSCSQTKKNPVQKPNFRLRKMEKVKRELSLGA